MKNHIQFETNGVRVLVVKVQDGADKICISHNAMWSNLSFRLPGAKPMPFGWTHIKLPEGDWIFHAVTTEMTEEQAKVLCKSTKHRTIPLYWDYLNGVMTLTAEQSLDSLMLDNGIDPNEKHVILINQEKLNNQLT